jgi:cell division protein FtsZ
MPFDFEGKSKMNIAKEGLAKLRSVVDVIIVIPNQNVYKIVDRHSSMAEMFLKVDDVLRQGIQGISDMITKHGVINIDFADVREFTRGQGGALIGIGNGSGENRAIDAATAAMSNPMLEESSIKGAQKILVNVTAGRDFSPPEFQEVAEKVTECADENVAIKTGLVIDESMEDRVAVTVVATGFEDPAITKINAAKNPEKGKNGGKGGEFLFYDEWQNYLGGGDKQPKTPPRGNDLDVPAVWRGGNVSMFENYGQSKHTGA